MSGILQDEIDVWNQKETNYRAQLQGMIERRIADPENVSLEAIDVMMKNVSNCIYQQLSLIHI